MALFGSRPRVFTGLSLGLALAALGCDPGPAPSTSSPAPSTTAKVSAIRPQGITLEMPREHVLASGGIDTFVGRPARLPYAFAGPGEPPLPIYLNRFGGTYSPGRDDSRQNTSIVPNRQSTVGGYSGSNAQWQQVVSCLTTMFAPYNVTITETEPAGGEYVEAVIGGTPQQVGLPNGVGGVAPIDSAQCSIIPNAIVFAFSDVVGSDPQGSCEIAAQEIAHAFSLDHEFYCPDPMTYLGGCGDKTFRDTAAQCGEYQARACNCGRNRQNSVQTLIEKLGAANGTPPPPPPNDPNPPVVNVLSPANGATLPENSMIQVSADVTDDVRVAAIELVWSYNNSVFPCPGTAGGGSVTCAVNGNTATWQIRVGQGDRTFQVRARDSAGNQTVSPARTIHLGTGTSTGDTTPPTATISSPADGATLQANSTIQVVATANDDTALGSVELLWNYGQNNFVCPFNGQGVTCTQQGSTYTWSLNVGVGTRTFSVRAIDTAGNQFVTPERTITLDANPTPPPPTGGDVVAEPNDDAGNAFAARCGNAIDLVVSSTNEDWFAFDAPAGTDVQVGVSAAAGTIIGVELYADDGTTRLAVTTDVLGAGGTITAASAGPRVLARITTTGDAVAYRLTTVCSMGPNPPPPPPTDDALEDNDDAAHATRATCNQSQPNLVAGDDDWFVVDVPAGQSLHAAIGGSGVMVSIFDTAEHEIAPAGQQARTTNLPGGDVLVKVGGASGSPSYTLGLECAPATDTPPTPLDGSSVDGGCTSTRTGAGASSALFGLLALGLALLRRRR